MSLTEQINNDLKEAMKAKDTVKLTALRAIKSQLLLAATEKGADGGSSDEAGIKMLQKLVKQRKESAELYLGQGRNDLADPELAEAAIIEKYLPKQLSEEELKPIIQAIIAKVGASGPQDMGKVMGAASQELAAKADGKTISSVVRQLLSN
ncbi:MAG: GatB/YqeY domain-containing protein [Flavobacteriales bacterium]|nr:GatB/YqeY domain-containing protein [Flavobacteriales bacterium]